MYNTFKELALETQEASNNHLEFFTNRNLGSRFRKETVYLNGNLVLKVNRSGHVVETQQKASLGEHLRLI